MDTSNRPRKRMRPTSNESGKRAPALQYLHRFRSLKTHEEREGGDYESTLLEILSQMEASTFNEAAIARKLHKKVLVNLGFSLKLDRLDQAALQAEFLWVLYQCAWSHRKQQDTESYCGKHEVEEAFVMVLQALEVLQENPSRLSTSTAIVFKGTCLQIIRLLMLQSPRIREMICSRRKLVESMLYVIVSMSKSSEHLSESSHLKCEPSSYLEIFAILRSLFPTSMNMITMAESIMSGNHQRAQNLSSSSKADQLFYLNCLLIHGASERCMKDSGFRQKISFTSDECLGENHLSSAVDCFRLMIDNWSMVVGMKNFFELLVEVLLERSNPNCSSKRVLVNCFERLVNTSKARYMLLELRGFGRVVQYLSEAVIGEIECKDTVEKAADVLCSIAMALPKSRAFKTSEPQDPYHVLSSLLSSENPEVLKRAVVCIRTLLKAAEGTRLTNDCCCKLISLLKGSPLHEVASKATQEVVAEIFHLLAQRDDSCLNFLTRQPEALSLVVRVASNEHHITLRRKAFTLLLQMSKNSCNHRILARQPGLLSAFFGYTRSASESDDQREIAKEQILFLVRSL